MEICVGRQPIFDRKLNIYGYELLYRRSDTNFFEVIDDNKATADLINNAFLSMCFKELTNGTRAFINFSKELIEKEIPLLLPKDSIAIEIIRRGIPTVPFFNACKKLKQQGYKLVLDNYIPHESFLPLVDIVDIIKVDFGSIPDSIQQRLLDKYKGKLLAMKIETREQYQKAVNMGFAYFQGYFFNKPVIIKARSIEALNINLIRILNELNKPEPEYDNIADIIEGDIGLTYTLLKISNTILFGSAYTIGSIKQALVRLGMNGIKKWVYILMVKSNQVIENRELIKNCLIRAKLMELLAAEREIKTRTLDFFIAGMFSSIDALLNRDMKSILDELPLADDIKAALLGEMNGIRKLLDLVLLYEAANWDKIDEEGLFNDITRECFMDLYLQALRWMMELDY